MNEFVKRDGAIYLNVPYAEAYIAKDLFNEDETQSTVATRYGDGFRVVGIFNIRFFDSDTEPRESKRLRTFNYPNMILTHPSESLIAKISLDPNQEPEDYYILKYYLGDEIMSAEEIKMVANCTKFLNMITRGKIPNTIPYSQFCEIWENNFQINSFNPGVPAVVMQMIWSEMCRDPNDITKPYRVIYGKGNASQTGYLPANMNNVASASAVFSALSFERQGETLATSLNMTRDGVVQHRSSIEEVLTM